MKCGCKKSLCSSRVCKCKKNESYCTDECACPEDQCRNREAEIEEKEETAEARTPQLEWEELWGSIGQEKELLESLNQFGVMPQRLKAIMKKRKEDFNEMTELLEEMNGLHLQNAVADALTEEEWKRFEKQLVQCRNCERKFHPGRIGRHQEICGRRTHIVNNNNQETKN